MTTSCSDDPIKDWLNKNCSADLDLSSMLMSFELKKLSTPLIRNRALVFRDNVSNTGELLQLPFFIASAPLMESAMNRMEQHLDGLKSVPLCLPELSDLYSRVERFPSEGLKSFEGLQLSEGTAKLISSGLSALGEVFELTGEKGTDKMKQAIEPALRIYDNSIPVIEHLFRATLCSFWTALEVLASDLWEDAVNSEPLKLASSALREKTDHEVEGITQKQVSVDALFKHNFDLSNVMGTVLKSKFDFSSVHGIEKAFRCIIRFDAWTDDEKRILILLEKSRHLIQHRAGIVDAKFLELTGTAANLGEPLVVSAPDLQNYRQAVTRAGWKLILQMENWFQENKASN